MQDGKMMRVFIKPSLGEHAYCASSLLGSNREEDLSLCWQVDKYDVILLHFFFAATRADLYFGSVEASRAGTR